MAILNALLVVAATSSVVSACHARFEKELRYLDLYLGVAPDNNGDIPSRDPKEFASYVTTAKSLDCDFERECLWRNAPSDGLLDTSDFWYFKKTDNKLLPVQIQPGRADIAEGSHLILAGNTSTVADSATLVSAPIACQRKQGNLSFHYWLYNSGRVEVIIVRATHRRRHLQTLFRPKTNCHILRPGNDICEVNIPPVNEPFRIAIRAFNLKDNVVGSMVLIKNITYRAETCGESPFPTIFGSKPLLPITTVPIQKVSDLNCDRPLSKCRWSNAETTVSEWKIGRNVDRWHELMEVSNLDKSYPNSSFLFLAVDALSPRRYATLRSDLIPCTQATTTLSLKYWLKAGTQVEICSVDVDGVALSCAYLTEEDAPGPIEIDFTLEMIAFDETSIGLVAISEIRLRGLLCSEETPPIVTTVDPPTIVSLFGLQHGPGPNVPYPLDLNCDFSQDYCSQWVNDDGVVAYGVAPRNSNKFPVPNGIKGNVAAFLLEGAKTSALRSREVPCAHNATVSVKYMRSEYGMVRLCALGECADGSKTSGEMVLMATSPTPFEVKLLVRRVLKQKQDGSVIPPRSDSRTKGHHEHGTLVQPSMMDYNLIQNESSMLTPEAIQLESQTTFSIEAASRKNAVVVINDISVSGRVCTLKTAEQLVCDKLQCNFSAKLCNYHSPIEKDGDKVLEVGHQGATVTLDEKSHRAVLRSVHFDLPTPILLNITITQATYGSRVLLCPDITSDSESCQELLGPRVTQTMERSVLFPLDVAAHQFALVLYHDKAEQFGPAKFIVHSIYIQSDDNQRLC
ncbi:unnamed protein product [Nippostrongylus brasiliensis]|uniref:MAM domain-containing protein n=1 Tax=Nippostrongylus brasiliensis TaxID=27835 RepID=A0A0N4YDS5_NIPBR|nr:unnamed protein product [Nippostrongylus brasiliensis]